MEGKKAGMMFGNAAEKGDNGAVAVEGFRSRTKDACLPQGIRTEDFGHGD